MTEPQILQFQRTLEENSRGVVLIPESEANLLRMLDAFFDPKLFIRDCISYPFFAKVFMLVAGHSNYLTDIVVRDPGPFYSLLADGFLQQRTRALHLKQTIRTGLLAYRTFDKKIAFLKNVKRRQTLKIALRDMLGYDTLSETTETLSLLAKVISQSVFTLCFNRSAEKLSGKILRPDYTIIALGKLGGNELNYSSDIDLMVFYKKNKKIGRVVEYFEVLTETIRLFSSEMSHPDENGYLYRVDFRLRPDGKAAPLCRTLNDTLRYYESRGEHWERQMLLKSGFVAGSKRLYDQFLSYVSHYIYPASAFSSPLEQIKRLRKNILKANRNEFNIKLSSGGIRDIEFGIQALQLIYGGKNSSIRSGNTLHAIELLHKKDLLNDDEKMQLTEAYSFYRKIEHYLQIMNDTQTHTIPDTGEISEKLTAYFGYASFTEFIAAVNARKVLVKKFYRSVIIDEEQAQSVQEDFERINFKNAESAWKNFLYLKEGKGLAGTKQFDNISIKAFDRIEASLLSVLFTSPDPDRLLTNFTRILNKVILPSVWYEQLKDKHFFDAFAALCSSNYLGFELLISNRNLQERFLTGKVFEPLQPGLEYSVEEIYFTLSTQFTVDMLTPDQMSEQISFFIKEKIELFLSSELENLGAGDKICVLLAGSIASETMSFTSDVDIVFIKEESYEFPELQEFFFSFLSRLKNYMSPLEIDVRLRPEGSTSVIIFNTSAYKKYLTERARIWEFQAMTKMIPLYGNISLFKKIKKYANKVISGKSLDYIASEVMLMRKKIIQSKMGESGILNLKRCIGGYQDLEFIVQFLILRESAYLALRGVAEFYSVLRYLKRKNVLSEKDFLVIKENYKFLKTLEILVQISVAPSENLKNINENVFIHLAAKYTGTTSTFMEKLDKTLSENNELFNRVINGGGRE